MDPGFLILKILLLRNKKIQDIRAACIFVKVLSANQK